MSDNNKQEKEKREFLIQRHRHAPQETIVETQYSYTKESLYLNIGVSLMGLNNFEGELELFVSPVEFEGKIWDMKPNWAIDVARQGNETLSVTRVS